MTADSSAYEPTASLLESRGWRGHFFIVTGRIGKPGFVTARQIRELHERGHHIGSHSHSHPDAFSELSDEELIREWSESRRILGEILGSPPWSASCTRRVLFQARGTGRARIRVPGYLQFRTHGQGETNCRSPGPGALHDKTAYLSRDRNGARTSRLHAAGETIPDLERKKATQEVRRQSLVAISSVVLCSV